MINIKIPNNNIKERRYIIDIIFNEFLGLEYSLEIASKDYEIVLANQKKLIIKDTFFNNYPNDLEYLRQENIPKSIKNLDIFAASFFMLTRWEEYANKNRDNHNRFPAYESLAYKEGFLDRPIINELLEELKDKLLYLDNSIVFKKRKFKFVLTHDVDAPLRYNSNIKIIKEIFGDIIKRKQYYIALKKFVDFMFVKLKIKKDPYDTFDWIMDKSEYKGIKSYFFFMAKGTSEYDNLYDINNKFILDLIDKIKSRGHFIGIHPTYNAYNNIEQLKNEKIDIEKVSKNKILFGREHFLRFEIPTTWQILEDIGMQWDSTLSYADKEGFRCGICYEYSVFNILTRKKLNLKEKPLIVMDGSFIKYQPDIEPSEMEIKIKNLINKVKEYNGDFVLLWHNSSFNTPLWQKYKKVYKKVLLK